MDETQLVLRKRRIANAAKVGLAVVGTVVVAPAVFLVVKGMAGIAIAGTIGLAIINFSSVVADKFANWRLIAIKAEAFRNPIETLQIDYSKKEEELSKFRDAITNFAAVVQTFEDKLDGFAEEFEDDAPKFKGELVKMKKLLELRRRRYKEAEGSVNKYALEIKRAKAIWQMGQEAAKMNKAAGMGDKDFLAKIKVETALDSVTTSMNAAFAELETSLLEEDASPEAKVVLEHIPKEGSKS